ncbi:MAG: BMP family protein [Chloroflexi bacterium]|nr:BMP family protein [Chloroflexota bacterium]
MRKQLSTLVVLVVILAMIAACAAPTPTPAPTAVPKAAAPTAAPAKVYKLAAVLPGVITDADYNTLGYIAATAVQAELGVKMGYSESVAVPDVERVMREYVDAGYNIIWTHGSQFISQTKNVAKAFPDVTFIGETDAPDPEAPANLWIIDRNFQTGFYALGVLAAKQTKTGKIGYLGGQTLGFSYAEVRAIQQAMKDTGSTATLKTVWAGDFNDPTKARQIADAMIAEGSDVIIGSLNLGMFGLFEAVKAGSGTVLVTAKYTDKSSYAPKNCITSLLYDFAGPLKTIVKRIQAGEKGSYYPLGFDTGVALQLPLKNVSDDVNKAAAQAIDDVKSGKIKVVKDNTPIK